MFQSCRSYFNFSCFYQSLLKYLCQAPVRCNCWNRHSSTCLGPAILYPFPTWCWGSSVISEPMKYLRVEFWAYLVVFAHKLEHRNLEVLGKMVLWRVLLHRIIRNTAEESRGRGFNGFPSNGKRKRKDIPAYLTRERKGGIGSLRLSYHLCYFLFGHRRKVGNDGGKQQRC